MSDNSKSSRSGGFGALGLFGVIGAITAWWTTPAFTLGVAGWAGIGKALLVGAGTSMGATIGAVPVILAGIVVLGIVGGVLLGKKGALAGVLLASILGGIGGGTYGAVRGYRFSKDTLTQPCTLANKTSQASFNQAVQLASSSYDAKTNTVTLKPAVHLG